VFCLIVPLLVIACGSTASPTPVTTQVKAQTIHGPGFEFETPATWRLGHTLTSASARSRAVTPATVSAQLYRLGKAYSPSEFAAAAHELDRVAKRLVSAAGGTISRSETTTVAGRQIRAYRFNSSHGQSRLGFLLDRKQEVQLLCQAPAGGDPDGACALLFATFRLTG